ncbi:MAG: DNA-3-methyladenine glycosylase I [Victivallales bacterium]|nr:DNA-3-methyladenine glycosylase I [Victivallales bacterium]
MKMIRCPYFELNELERAYHDKEWGTPCRNDRKLFEYLMYEVLQCGLSWNTILTKREVFRLAFEHFDFNRIVRYGESDIERILAVPEMIRSRRKVEAIIHDAKCFLEIRREHGTFSKWLWAFTDGKTLLNPENAKSDEWVVPARTELSDRIAAELKKRGFKFLGTVTVYAFMQSVGLVNDHARFCFRYKELVANQH